MSDSSRPNDTWRDENGLETTGRGTKRFLEFFSSYQEKKEDILITRTRSCESKKQKNLFLESFSTRGRFGCYPELLNMDKSVWSSQEASLNVLNHENPHGIHPWSDVFLDPFNHYGIVLSGYSSGHQQAESSSSLHRSTLESCDPQTVEQMSEDPSEYFRFLRDTVTHILDTERREREEKASQHVEQTNATPITLVKATYVPEAGKLEKEELEIVDTVQTHHPHPQDECDDPNIQRAEAHETSQSLEGFSGESLGILEPQDGSLVPPTISDEVSHHSYTSEDPPKKNISELSQGESDFIKTKIELHNSLMNYLTSEFLYVKNNKNDQIKQFRISIKKAITLTINQLASTRTQIESVANRLVDCLMTLYKMTGETQSNLKLYRFAVTTTVQMILDNVQVQVVSNPRSVWSFSHLVSRLGCCADFGQYFESMTLTRCPYIIPYPQASWMALETEKKHEAECVIPLQVERFVSLLRLWQAFLIISYENNTIRDGLEKIWSWYARFLNTKEPPLLFPRLLSAALEVSGFALLKAYPTQFKKILNSSIFLHTLPVYGQMKSRDPSGIISASLARIKIYLDEFKRSDSVPISEGYTLIDKPSMC